MLTSRRAPGLGDLVEAADRPGAAFEIVALLASHAGSDALAQARSAGIPARLHDAAAFCAERGSKVGDLSVRPEYDRATLEILAPFRPDLVVLCGYLLLVTAPLLEAFPDRIVSVHDADLRVIGPGGHPAWPGLHATRDAIEGGAAETRTTLHVVTDDLDAGPPLLVSWAFPVHGMVAMGGPRDVVRAYAYAHRGWMMQSAWGPLLVRAAELFARGAIRVRPDGATVDGRPGPLVLAGPRRAAPPLGLAVSGGGR